MQNRRPRSLAVIPKLATELPHIPGLPDDVKVFVVHSRHGPEMLLWHPKAGPLQVKEVMRDGTARIQRSVTKQGLHFLWPWQGIKMLFGLLVYFCCVCGCFFGRVMLHISTLPKMASGQRGDFGTRPGRHTWLGRIITTFLTLATLVLMLRISKITVPQLQDTTGDAAPPGGMVTTFLPGLPFLDEAYFLARCLREEHDDSMSKYGDHYVKWKTLEAVVSEGASVKTDFLWRVMTTTHSLPDSGQHVVCPDDPFSSFMDKVDTMTMSTPFQTSPLEMANQMKEMVNSWALKCLGYNWTLYDAMHEASLQQTGYVKFHVYRDSEMLLLSKFYQHGLVDVGDLGAAVQESIYKQDNTRDCGYTCYAYVHLDAEEVTNYDALPISRVRNLVQEYVRKLVAYYDGGHCVEVPSVDLVRWRGEALDVDLLGTAWERMWWRSKQLRWLSQNYSPFYDHLRPTWDSLWMFVLFDVFVLFGVVLPARLLFKFLCMLLPIATLVMGSGNRALRSRVNIMRKTKTIYVEPARAQEEVVTTRTQNRTGRPISRNTVRATRGGTKKLPGSSIGLWRWFQVFQGVATAVLVWRLSMSTAAHLPGTRAAIEGWGSQAGATLPHFAFLAEAYCTVRQGYSMPEYDEEYVYKHTKDWVVAEDITNKAQFLILVTAVLGMKQPCPDDPLELLARRIETLFPWQMMRLSRSVTADSMMIGKAGVVVQDMVNAWALKCMGFNWTLYDAMQETSLREAGYVQFHKDKHRQGMLLSKFHQKGLVTPGFDLGDVLPKAFYKMKYVRGCGFTCYAYLHLDATELASYSSIPVSRLKHLAQQYARTLTTKYGGPCVETPSPELMQWRGKALDVELWGDAGGAVRWKSKWLRWLMETHGPDLDRHTWSSLWPYVMVDVVSLFGVWYPLWLLLRMLCSLPYSTALMVGTGVRALQSCSKKLQTSKPVPARVNEAGATRKTPNGPGPRKANSKSAKEGKGGGRSGLKSKNSMGKQGVRGGGGVQGDDGATTRPMGGGDAQGVDADVSHKNILPSVPDGGGGDVSGVDACVNQHGMSMNAAGGNGGDGRRVDAHVERDGSDAVPVQSPDIHTDGCKITCSMEDPGENKRHSPNVLQSPAFNNRTKHNRLSSNEPAEVSIPSEKLVGTRKHTFHATASNHQDQAPSNEPKPRDSMLMSNVPDAQSYGVYDRLSSKPKAASSNQTEPAVPASPGTPDAHEHRIQNNTSTTPQQASHDGLVQHIGTSFNADDANNHTMPNKQNTKPQIGPSSEEGPQTPTAPETLGSHTRRTQYRGLSTPRSAYFDGPGRHVAKSSKAPEVYCDGNQNKQSSAPLAASSNEAGPQTPMAPETPETLDGHRRNASSSTNQATSQALESSTTSNTSGGNDTSVMHLLSLLCPAETVQHARHETATVVGATLGDATGRQGSRGTEGVAPNAQVAAGLRGSQTQVHLADQQPWLMALLQPQEHVSLGQYDAMPTAEPQAKEHDVQLAEEFATPMACPVDDFDWIPEELCCPITTEVMVDPVMAADGFTYERAVISQWLQKHDTSPMTNKVLTNKELRTNWELKGKIDELLGQGEQTK